MTLHRKTGMFLKPEQCPQAGRERMCRDLR
jgi:hypothetical protein